jgi:hypothetical protein
MREGEPKFEEKPQIQEAQEQQSGKELRWQEAEQQLEKFGGIEEGIKETVVGLNVFNIETVNSCEGHNNHGRIAPWVSIEKWESKPREKYIGQKDFERVAYERLGVTEDFLKRNSDYIREFDERRVSLLPSGKVEPDETTDWEKHSKEIAELDEEVRKKYGIAHSDDRKWVEAGMQVEKEVEDAGKDNRLQQTEEYKKWKTENDAMKDEAQQLLYGFYSDRKTAEGVKIIIDQDGTGSWCIHNGGRDYYDVTRRQDEIPDAEKKHYQEILDGKNPKKEQNDMEGRVEKYRMEFKEFAKFCKEKYLGGETETHEPSPEFIEALEKTPFSPEDQVWILLTKAGLKPASWVDFVIRNESDGRINKKLSEDEVQSTTSFMRESFPCAVKRKIHNIKRTSEGDFVGGPKRGIKVGEEEQISFVIGSDQDNFDKLSSAIKSKNEKAIGLALGYEPSAVDAYAKNELFHNEKLPDEVLFSEAFAFNPGRLSSEHWQEELARYQKWADYVKRVSPSLFNKMMGFKLEK